MSLTILVCILTLRLSSNGVSAEYPGPDPESKNWTSCHEFVNNSKLDPDRLVDIDWKIFYFWNPEVEASYNMKFSRPSSVLIDRFRVELDKELKPPANWSKAELFMETSLEFSALYLRTATPGIFRIIPTTAFEYNVPIPLLIFAMKYVEPGYLGISNCKYRICYALAPVDKMPYHNELEKAARMLHFYNPYNRSHISPPAMRKTDIPYSTEYAAKMLDDHDEHLEIEQDLSKVDFF